jgi:hypothetical protein
LIGAVAMVAPWPWTLLAIKPTNDALRATAPEPGRAAVRALATIDFLWTCLPR